MKLKSTTVITLLSIISLFATAQKAPTVKWVVKDPFEQKVFIENKGQFQLPDKGLSSGDITFGANIDGLHYLFTKNSIWINHIISVKRSSAEVAQLKSKYGLNDADTAQLNSLSNKAQAQSHQLNFIGANTDVKVICSGEVKNYYVYGDSPENAIMAHAYKKITYLNLYNGIDMEVYFPQDKKGFEYDFIVHPGADPSQIKIQYPLNKGVNLTGGNIVTTADFGEVVDHTPVASITETSNVVACSFKMNNSIVQFNIGDYNKNQTLRIDPWNSVTPPFKLTNAYDVDYDNGSNCYIYGGKEALGSWQFAKYDGSGGLEWTYSVTPFSGSVVYFGHFAVDRITQSVYIVEGYNVSTGARILKLDKGGNLVKTFAGNANLPEMWRIAYARCTPHIAVIGGGNSTKTAGGTLDMATDLDSTLGSVTPVNTLNSGSGSGYHNVCLLTVDNTGQNAFMGISASSQTAGYNNVVVSAPITALSPTAWNKADNYHFTDGISVMYHGLESVEPNGFNGMAYGSTGNMYTYDSYTLEKWNAGTGAISATKTVNAGNPTTMYWGGLDADICDHIFLGSLDHILQYDGNLNLITTITAPDSVYDVKLGSHYYLYACGVNFVEVLQTNLTACTAITADTATLNASCTQPGSFTITPTAGPAPYSYILHDSVGTAIDSINAAAGYTFANLNKGTYTATVTDTSCMHERLTYTFKVHKIVTYAKGIVTPNPVAICIGNDTTLVASGAQSYTWLSTSLQKSTTLSDSTGTNIVTTPTVTTTYIFIGRQAGDCPDTQRVIVNVNLLPNVIVSPLPASVCTGGNVQLTASVKNNNGKFYNWTPPTGLSATSGATVTATPTATTTYTIMAEDNNGCKNDTAIAVTVNPYPVITATPDSQGMCVGNSVNLTASSNIPGTTYTWSSSTGLSATTGASVTANPTTTTIYQISGAVGGCTTTPATPDTVTVNPLPNIVITNQLSPTYCIDATAVQLTGSTPTGGIYSGPGISDTTFTPSSAGAGGPYTIKYTFTDANGCTNLDSAHTTVNPLPTLSILPAKPAVCSGQPATLTASGATSYTWSPSTDLSSTDGNPVTATPTTPTRYTVTGTDANGCMDTLSTLVNIGVLPNPSFVTATPSECNSLVVQFTDLDFTANQTYFWKFGDGDSSNVMNPQHVYLVGGGDTVSLIETNAQGCSKDTSEVIQVVSLTQEVEAPNAFIPDDPSGLNIRFTPVVNCNMPSNYILRIYNRWGQQVFESNDPGNTGGWDGRFNGQIEPIGVYVYYIQFVCGTCPISVKGNITLLR